VVLPSTRRLCETAPDRARRSVSWVSVDCECSLTFVRESELTRRGHYAVLFGTALGAEVTVFSRSDAKKEDALKMGAKRFVATTEGFAKDLALEFDLIIVTASSSRLPLDELLSTLYVNQKLVFVGMPEEGLSNVKSQTLSGNGASLASSHLGNKQEAIEMLKLAADKKIEPWINVLQMKDAAKAIKAVEDNSVRYRSILIQDIEPVK